MANIRVLENEGDYFEIYGEPVIIKRTGNNEITLRFISCWPQKPDIKIHTGGILIVEIAPIEPQSENGLNQPAPV